MTPLIQTAELQKELASLNPPVLIDVRLKDDFEEAHIPNAVSNCVYEVAFLDRVTVEKTQPIVVYGADSESYETRMAKEKLRRVGYANVTEYRDGFRAWQDAGGSVTRNKPRPADPVVTDGTHAIDLKESFIEWNGRNLLHKHHGRIGFRSGSLEIAQANLVNGNFVIDLQGIACSNLQGTDLHDILIHHLKSDDFFDVERFPEARFVIQHAKRIEGVIAGRPNLEITGELSLKDVSASITFLATAGVTAEGKAAAQAVLSFDRTQWNVIYGSARFFNRLGMHLVNDLIDLDIRIVAA
jgi:rhodanese-related sulfurtransferase/polyisoprenoid-binding protein YceI